MDGTVDDNSTLTVEILRHAAYYCQGTDWRVSPFLPENTILWMPNGLVAVSSDVDQAVSHSFDFIKALEQLRQDRPNLDVIDLRGCEGYIAAYGRNTAPIKPPSLHT